VEVPQTERPDQLHRSRQQDHEELGYQSVHAGYKAQAAVGVASQVMVGADVTRQSNDKKQLEPMFAEAREKCNAP